MLLFDKRRPINIWIIEIIIEVCGHLNVLNIRVGVSKKTLVIFLIWCLIDFLYAADGYRGLIQGRFLVWRMQTFLSKPLSDDSNVTSDKMSRSVYNSIHNRKRKKKNNNITKTWITCVDSYIFSVNYRFISSTKLMQVPNNHVLNT